MPGQPDHIARSHSALTYHKISAGSTNADNVKASAAVLTGYYLVNTALTFRYVKLYNTAGTPTAGSGTPRCVYGIPPSSAANMNLDPPVAFETGIGVTIVTGIADSDATAVALNDVAVTLYYM